MNVPLRYRIDNRGDGWLSPKVSVWTVLPSLSRAIIAVEVSVMCEPSASVRLASVTACALYGWFFTTSRLPEIP